MPPCPFCTAFPPRACVARSAVVQPYLLAVSVLFSVVVAQAQQVFISPMILGGWVPLDQTQVPTRPIPHTRPPTREDTTDMHLGAAGESVDRRHSRTHPSVGCSQVSTCASAAQPPVCSLRHLELRSAAILSVRRISSSRRAPTSPKCSTALTRSQNTRCLLSAMPFSSLDTTPHATPVAPKAATEVACGCAPGSCSSPSGEPIEPTPSPT